MAHTDAWGVDDGYHDVNGGWHSVDGGTRAALHRAMGADGHDAPPGSRPLWIVRPGGADALLGPCVLVLEDGTDLGVVTALPPDLPLGYHRLRPVDGGPETRLVCSPGRCHLPRELRAWLLGVQLYAARSHASWGIGDLADLRLIGDQVAARGAWGAAVNPLHAPLPLDRQEPSPYFPSSRRWRTPLAISIDALPGADADPEVRVLADEARRLNERRFIDRDAVWARKRRALELLWSKGGRGRDFSTWRAAQGTALEGYARFCALADEHRAGWRAWPAGHRHPDSPAVEHFASSYADRVAFHAWLQWLIEGQLGAVGVPVLHDLAVGVDPDGADAWLHQDLLALDVSVGAPPDDFARDGQDWGLPPFIPWRLRDAGYAPVAEVMRAALAHGGGLRVDHVMGLFRLYWIPAGAPPAEGAYVRYPGRELLDILALESARAEAIVVGEDLGTVEPDVRDALDDAGIVSYRLAWFEPGPPESYPQQSLAAVTTHDLPTIAGVWSGSDADELRSLGREADADAVRGLAARLATLTGLPEGAPVDDVIVAAHSRLAAGASALVTANLDDALGVAERVNVPGTTDKRPNWSLALPLALEDAFASPLFEQVVDAMAPRAG